MRNKWIYDNKCLSILCSVLFITLLVSCNYTKHLSDNQTLVHKNTVHLKTIRPIKYKGEFESSILSLANPPANTHMFDLDFMPKYKLWKYNNRYKYYALNDTDKKITRHKVERPSLLDTNLIKRSERNIRQYLENQGFYYAKVNSSITPIGHKKATINYDIETGRSFYINQIYHEFDKASITQVYGDDHDSYFKKGDVFTNFTCGFEQERIYKLMQQEGFYDFKADNVSFLVDTSNKKALLKLMDDPFDAGLNFKPGEQLQNDSANVKIIISQTKDSNYAIQYYIDSVIVEIRDKYSEADEKMTFTENQLDGIFFKYQTLPLNRKVIVRNIFIQPNDRYNPKDKELTINRLNQLNVFQLVNVVYDKIPQKPGRLVCRIRLDMQRKKEYSLNLDANTTDADYFFGFGTSLQYKDKNLFHGANQLSIKGSVSAQFRNDTLLNGVKQIYLSGNNVNVNANITFPKFIVPFIQHKFSKKNVPFTLVGFNYNYILRRSNYTIKNVSGSFGYTWKETDRKSWRLNPAFLTLTFVPERFLSDAFQKRKNESAYLSSIFSSNIIYGENVTYEYRTKEKGLYKNINTLKIGVEEAGTILKGINTIYHNLTQENIEPISHYLRLDGDYRKYINRRKSQWVNRLMIGIGTPFSNGNSLPYIKQYTAGGSFSLRGFQARTIGPGRSSDTSFTGNNLLIDRTGDIKFEANTEYRFNLLKLFSGAINLKGAGFIDVGNIWLYKKDASIPGGEFNSNYFFRDLAMCTGVGLRLDFSFFVVRVDMAYPVKQPSIQRNYGFVFDQLNYYKDANFVVGFGYPF